MIHLIEETTIKMLIFFICNMVLSYIKDNVKNAETMDILLEFIMVKYDVLISCNAKLTSQPKISVNMKSLDQLNFNASLSDIRVS